MSKDSILKQKSMDFAKRIVRLYQFLIREKRESIMSKQLLRSGTSIGANIIESQQAQSRADFVSKLNIALKEASETEYWIKLLYRTDYLQKTQYESLCNDINDLISILTAICRSANSQK